MNEKEPNFYNQENVEETETQSKVERIFEVDDKTLRQVVQIEKDCFPEDMQESEEEIRKILENKNGIHLKLENNGAIVGYITSLKQDQEFDLLKESDADLKNEQGSLYLHSIDITPKNRNLKNFNALFGELIDEAKKENYKKVTMYARTSNRFSSILQKRYGAKFFRSIKDWRNLGEDMDYLEIDLPKTAEE